ncbi:MAG: hypothetical protein ACK5ZV_09750, partial [bacterium]
RPGTAEPNNQSAASPGDGRSRVGAGSASTRQAPQGTPLAPGSQAMDARPGSGGPSDTQRERTIAEWFGQGAAGPGGAGASSGPADAQQVLERAANAGKQAVEDRVVPGRMDGLLQRWFRRSLPQAVGGGTAAPATPAGQTQPSAAPPSGPAPVAPAAPSAGGGGK